MRLWATVRPTVHGSTNFDLAFTSVLALLKAKLAHTCAHDQRILRWGHNKLHFESRHILIPGYVCTIMHGNGVQVWELRGKFLWN